MMRCFIACAATIMLAQLNAQSMPFSTQHSHGHNYDSIQWKSIYFGIEPSALLSRYPGLGVQVSYFISDSDFFSLRPVLILNENPKLIGYDAKFSYNKRIFSSMYLGIGLRHAATRLNDKVIFQVSNNQFRQEVSVVQNRSFLAGTYGLGFLVPFNEFIFIDFFSQIVSGTERFSGIDNLPRNGTISRSHRVNNQLMITEAGMSSKRAFLELDISILMKF
jgi:hypothetical protein